MPYAPAPDAAVVRRLVPLLVGIVLVGVGVSVTITAEVGVAPYDVLTTGLAELTGMPLGLSAVCVPAAFVVIALLLGGGRIGPGTAIAMVGVGPVIAVMLEVLPDVEPLPPRIAMFAVGATTIALGITSTVVAELGPGPAEAPMLALVDRGLPLAPVRTGIEITSVAVGWLMGGQVGVGTIVFALLIGPALRVLLDLSGYQGHRDV